MLPEFLSAKVSAAWGGVGASPDNPTTPMAQPDTMPSMARGNEHDGLLKAIIEVFNDEDPGECLHYENVTNRLIERGQWIGKQAATPAQTVESYLTQNPSIFKSAGYGSPGMYYLDESRHKRKPKSSLDES